MPVALDPLLEPGALLTDGRPKGKHLYQVLRINYGTTFTRVVVLDCMDDKEHQFSLGDVRQKWSLVRRAPTIVVPDSVSAA